MKSFEMFVTFVLPILIMCANFNEFKQLLDELFGNENRMKVTKF